MSYDFPNDPAPGQEYVPPAGGQTYIWKPPKWMVKGIPPEAGVGGSVDEAPIDGMQYARQDAAWTQLDIPEGDWAGITGKPATFPPTLPIAQSGVTNLTSDLSALSGRVTATETTNTSQTTAISQLQTTDATHDGRLNNIEAANTAQNTAINGKEPTIAGGVAMQYWRGDKTWQTLDKNAVGLSNVDNTSDANKPVSTAQAAAIATKEPTITEGTTGQYWRGDKSWQPLPASIDQPTADTRYVNTSGDTMTGTLAIQSVDGSASAGPFIQLLRDSPTPAISDQLGLISFQGRDSAGNATEYASINGQIFDPADGNERAQIIFRAQTNGVMTTKMTIDPGSVAISTGLFVNGTIVAQTGFVTGANSFISLSTPFGQNGTVYFRPQGSGSVTNQASLDPNGVFTLATTPTAGDNTLKAATTAFVTAAVAAKVSDAPSDGKQYVRKDGAWVEITTPVVFDTNGDAVVKFGASIVIRIKPTGLILTKDDIEVFSVSV